MFIVENFVDVVKRYVDFNGRATRSEFWYFTLANAILGFILGIILGISGLISPSLAYLLVLLIVLFFLALLLPSLSLTVRRLHDTNKSAWWLLLALVPIIGPLALLFFYCQDGTPGRNQFGPDPKGR